MCIMRYEVLADATFYSEFLIHYLKSAALITRSGEGLKC